MYNSCGGENPFLIYCPGVRVPSTASSLSHIFTLCVCVCVSRSILANRQSKTNTCCLPVCRSFVCSAHHAPDSAPSLLLFLFFAVFFFFFRLTTIKLIKISVEPFVCRWDRTLEKSPIFFHSSSLAARFARNRGTRKAEQNNRRRIYLQSTKARRPRAFREQFWHIHNGQRKTEWNKIN